MPGTLAQNPQARRVKLVKRKWVVKASQGRKVVNCDYERSHTSSDPPPRAYHTGNGIVSSEHPQARKNVPKGFQCDMPLVGIGGSAANYYDERLTIIVPHICARFFRTRLDSLFFLNCYLPICARQAVGVQFERRVNLLLYLYLYPCRDQEAASVQSGNEASFDLESFWDISCELEDVLATVPGVSRCSLTPILLPRFHSQCDMPLVGDRRICCQFYDSQSFCSFRLRRLASYSSAIHTLKITNTSQGLRLTLPSRLRRSLRAQRTGRKTAIPMRMIVTRLMFIRLIDAKNRCPTFTPVGETLALSPALANFAPVLQGSPYSSREHPSPCFRCLPENSALPPVVLSVIPMPYYL
ncbi:hypothetical protein BT96DRAFT_1007436 [Gymnopus androsaceus JB14]|uniref:Uncharacterized protein n=1 Tax=Gymnopus androsaceus JB14 TaxID=1447944 RepID=A0A6A4GI72_9AGAR|nr:hypothetical protein BT96DRAFT_1007436 [Gymnopus androsaceus JB14]